MGAVGSKAWLSMLVLQICPSAPAMPTTVFLAPGVRSLKPDNPLLLTPPSLLFSILPITALQTLRALPYPCSLSHHQDAS